MDAHSVLLAMHSVIRWAIVVFAIAAIGNSVQGWKSGRAWEAKDRGITMALIGTLDLQMLLGFILFGISPFMKAAMANMKATMKTGSLRFFVVEHPFLMIAAIVLMHIVYAKVKRMDAEDDTRRFKTLSIGLIIGFILVLAGVPWPGTPGARPLMPGF